jgi:predicted unusual protein kinase regulating ubiquinone biosynthesis (AarF/ABC1/UbiB family)
MGKPVRRVLKAFWVLTPIVITHARDMNRYLVFGGKRELSREQMRQRARRLADAFEGLGVTYIKLAQFLTTRPDFVPPVYIDELQRLQDDVPPEEFGSVETVLEDELGPIEEVFDSFEEEPLSSASIAQVHRARVDGEEVAVKVQRPGIKGIIEADLRALSIMVSILYRLLRVAGQYSHAESLVAVTDDVDKTLREEVDFGREASIMSEIRENVVSEGFDEEVVIPEPHEEYSTERVITMSFEDGVKIKDINAIEERGHDLETVAERLVEAYLRMAFVYGVYQTDPHHGNIAVNDEGKVVIYDYGLSQKPKSEVTDAFARFFAGLGIQDPDMVVAALEDMEAVEISSGKEYDAVRDWADALSNDVAGDISDIDMGSIGEKFDESFEDFPLRLNQDILLGLRTTTGVQGIAARVDPDYDFSTHLARFFVEKDIFNLELEEIRQEAEERSQRSYVDSIKQELKDEVKKGNKRTVLSVVGSTLVLGSGIVYATTLGSLLPGALLSAGVLVFLTVALSFRESNEVVGPMFMMRYEMEQWDDEYRTEEEIERRETADGEAKKAKATVEQ